MQDLRITLVQADLFWENPDANLARFDERLAPYRDTQDLVLLPEMFNTGFSTNPAPIAEKTNGRTMLWLSHKAKELGCVVAGSLIIQDRHRYFNQLVWMQPDGSFETYDKRHLFTLAGEHLHFSGGTRRLVTELKGWKICPMICYDLRFPVWSMNTYKAGIYQYDLLIYLANWPEVRSQAWKTLLAARAVENLSYVAAVNRVGKDGNGIPHSGDSAVIDFKGQHMQDIPAHMEGEATVTLFGDALQEFRQKYNFGRDWDQFVINL